MQHFKFSFSILIFMVYSCGSSPEQIRTSNESLLGSWRLLADQEIDSIGRVIRQDTAVSGLLIYTPEGKMSVQLLWHGTRSKIMTDSIMNKDGVSFGTGIGTNTWTPQEARTILDSYDAYFGDYSIDQVNDIVIHRITGNLRPENKGTSYKRAFRLQRDTLFLRSTDPKMKWQVAWLKNITD